MNINDIVLEAIDLNTASEAEQIAAVQKSGTAIKDIKNPSEAVQLAAVKQHWTAYQYIDNPSEAAQLAILEYSWAAIQHIKNPSEAVQLAAVKKNSFAIRYIENPSEALQLAVVKVNVDALHYIKNPSEAVQLAAVQHHPKAIKFIKNPSEAVQLAAVQQNGTIIRYIENPSEAAQLAAVKEDINALKDIRDISTAVQVAAVKQNINAIQLIENPSAAAFIVVILICIKNKEINKARLILHNLKSKHPDTPEIAKLDSVLNSSSEPKQINELTPYRSNPDYQKAREIFADPEPYPLNRRRKTKLDILTAWLEKHGFKKLGQGSFGAVYEKPGYPWVFKVFNNDPAYMHFLRYAMAHQSNPHLPKIRGLMKIDDKTYVVRMENLKQIPLGLEPATTLVRQIHNMDSYGDLSEKQVEWIKTTLPGIHQFFMTFPLGGYEYDIHYDNLMMRGNTIVIVDPLYDWHGMEGDE